MKLKKTLFFSCILICLYLAIGAILLFNEKIQRLYIFPGWSIKYGKTDEDHSTIGTDGPIILYENSKIYKYQILSKEKLYTTIKSKINKNDTLNCYVDETKDSFNFQLKDNLGIEPSTYILPKKMLIISDIEGNFKGFKSILLGNKIIDNNLKWTFGENHLVLIGDFFDRGLNITECLWLIYKLEKEAEKKGGKVHFLLGNHEMMNLKFQFKYVRDKYFENAKVLKLNYDKWYGSNTELGKWLRTKNGIEKIGNYLFTHAGVKKNFPNIYNIEEINQNIRKNIDVGFEKEMEKENIFIGKESPIWYRGIANKDESQNDIENTLANFKASKMIIGHTIFEKIQYLYNSKIIAIDIEHKVNSDNGKMFALWFENNDFKITDHNGNKTPLK